MDTLFAVSASGMRAANTRHDVTAHDVANINTTGFEERRPVQVETHPGTEVAALKTTPNRRPDAMSNTRFEEEAKEMMVNRNVYGANGRAFRVQDRMIGEVIDLVG